MPVAPGTRIGHYEVGALIGAGGMGEVYRASDTKLKRAVALKVLPAAFAHDPERLARFQREAELLASLNHPNIAAIYGVEHDGDTHALAMELVEGESPKGPMSFGDAWTIASQIADALEYAHDKGVIHRDLKPANVKVTVEGVVKLLDFGLAKAMEPPREEASPENSPTLTIGATEAGTILGTAAYMAPEQAKGRRADRRSDIWSFGVVVYEMLTGKRPFEGETTVDILGAVLNKEPDWTPVPERMRRLLQRCLQKDRKQRLGAISDAKWMIEEEAAVGGVNAQVAAVSQAASRRAVAWMAATALAIIVAAGASFIAYRETRPARLKPLVRLEMNVQAAAANSSAPGNHVIISPDGTRLVYVGRNGRLYARRLDQSSTAELEGTEDARSPFFSPDGRWVAFFAQGALKKISIEGGAPVTLCNAADLEGGSWGEDGTIVAALGFARPLSRVSSDGGQPQAVTELAAGERMHLWPQLLPGGRAVLFTANSPVNGFDGFNIEVMSFADRRTKTLQHGGTFGRYIAISKDAGYLLYVNNGTLFAARFDPNALELRGAPAPVLDGVSYDPGGYAQVDVSGYPGSGTLIYLRGGAGGTNLSTVQWLEPSGQTEPLLATPGRYYTPRVSPDGHRLALVVREGINPDIWIYETQRDTMTRLTLGGRNQNPTWSPDGRYIVFEGAGGMFWTRSDGAGNPQPLTQSNERQAPYSFTPDAARLAFFTVSATAGARVWTVPVKAGDQGLSAGTPERFPQNATASIERHPSFSPDGHWLAYTSNESGSDQIYVRAFPDKGGRWQISNAGGLYPRWSRNGRELFYRNNDNRLMVTAYTAKGDSFAADKPRAWAQQQMVPDPGFNGITYDVAPDGRVAALIPAEVSERDQTQDQLIFLENFVDELRRKVPTNK